MIMKTYKQLEIDKQKYLEDNSFFLLESLTDFAWIDNRLNEINLELIKKEIANKTFYIKKDFDYFHKIAPLIATLSKKHDVRVKTFVPNIFIRLLYGKNITGLEINIYRTFPDEYPETW